MILDGGLSHLEVNRDFLWGSEDLWYESAFRRKHGSLGFWL